MSLDDVFAGGGQMGAQMRELDWAGTPLGPPAQWPQSLKTCVRIILTSRQPMFVWWGEPLINLYNDAYRAILGGKHPSALARPASEVWREIWDEVGPRAATAMRANEGTYDEALLLIMERNGYPEETYYTFSYSPVPNEQGGPGGILCANTEDTGRIVGERQLALLRDLAARTAEARSLTDTIDRAAGALAGATRDLPFAALYLRTQSGRLELARPIGITAAALAPIEASPAMIAMVDAPAMRTLAADPAWALPTGAWSRPPHQLVLLPIAAPSPRGRSGALVVGANPFRLLDGAYRGFLELAAGQLAASLAAAEAYEHERQRAEALAELDRAKTVFFSNVSHEFRTPLTLMLGPQEDALRSPTGALAGDALAGVHRNTLRLLKLVNSLLDFSRIEAGRIQAAYEPIDLAVLTRELAGTFRAAVERAGLALDVDCAELGEPICVDREMWEKIVLNLLSNAFKFTFDGGIRVELRRHGDHAVLRVIDSGVGIAAGELPRVFERFHRVEGTRARTHEGTGIGLALVQDLVKLHGGTIAVASTLGIGTTFTVRVPYGTAHLPADRITAPRAASSAISADVFVAEVERWLPDRGAPTAPAPAAAAGHVLVVDDNADMRDYLSHLLRDHGWRVDTARDGADAHARARAQPPDLVLTDVMMPGLDGLQLLRALRADPRTALVPVIMLSARAGEESRVEGLAAGADDYLVKPFSARELLARATTHVQLGRLRRETERAHQQLRDLVMQSPIAMAMLEGPEHRFVIVNQRYLDMLDRDHVVGRTIAEVFPEIADTPLMDIFHRVYATGEPFSTDEYATALRRHGALEECHFKFSTVAVRAADGTITGIMATAVEVTEQVRARRALELSEGRLRRVVESNVIGFASIDLDGRVLDANDYFLAVVGVSRDELATGTVRLDDLTPPEDRARSAAAVRELRDTGVCEPYEKSYLRSDGRRVPVVVGSTLVPGPGREAISFVLDISSRKKIEEQNLVLRAQAESANRAKDEFLAMLGHELRNPLAPILTALNLMRLRGNDAVEKERTVIERQAQHLVHLVDDLLDVSRITRGKIELKRARVELAEVVARAIEMASPLIEQRRHTLAVYVPARGLAVDADPARLAQVVANLLTNAAKYTEPGGRIVIHAVHKDGRLELTVRDTGIGIAPEILPHVFDLFVQERQTLDRSQGGLGLGLAIVRSLVELHGGTVAAGSPGRGAGSEFTIRLPAADELVVDAPPVRAMGTDRGPAIARRRILIVDDNEDAAALLAEYLEAMGNITRVAHDGAQALRLVEDFVPELALLDIGLPVMDGYELAQHLRARLGHDRLKLVAVTGYGQESDRERARQASFDAHLVKPIDFARLDRLLTGA